MTAWLAQLLALAAWGFTLAAAAQSCPPPVLPVAVPAVPAVPSVDRGLLWRLQRDGHISWLYGTLHVGKPAWSPGPQVAAALRASSVLALELDPADPELQREMLQALPVLAAPEALALRLQRASERACLRVLALAPLHPLLQAMTLTVIDARWLGLDPAFGLDRRLASEALAAARDVVSLETASQQMAALVPADEAEALTLVEQTMQQLEDGSARRVLQRLLDAWQAGDLAALERYESWCECAVSEANRRLLQRVNDGRNPALAVGIDLLHARHRGGVFAAVGALHMTGAKSLTRLLAARGFEVERVPFKP
jgi:uncharacterized protein